MKIRSIVLQVASICALAGTAQADVTVQMMAVSDAGTMEPLGTVVISDAAHGLAFTPALDGLSPGAHGFHVHENPDCEPELEDGSPQAALAAGDHYDPNPNTQHGDPFTDGHMGDLPVLVADANGRVVMPVMAPRLSMEDVNDRALVIHAGGDNYSDTPDPSGGGGARIACGVIHL